MRHKAWQLVRQAAAGPAERFDLEQALWLDLLARWPRFDDRKATARTFAARVVTHEAARISRRREAAPERLGTQSVSLDELVPDGEGRLVARIEQIESSSHFRPAGRNDRPPHESSDLAADVQAVLGRLPAPLRTLCEQLKDCSVSEAARRLNLSRGAVYRALEKIREHFAAAGLQEYF